MIILSENLGTHSDSILIRKFIGDVSVQDIIESWVDLKENGLIQSKLKGIVNDLRDCNLNMDMHSFKLVIKYLKSNSDIMVLRHAVISDSPGIIVFPTLAEGQEKELRIKPFSTIESATEWILSQY